MLVLLDFIGHGISKHGNDVVFGEGCFILDRDGQCCRRDEDEDDSDTAGHDRRLTDVQVR
jgi:hypothetical protein